MLWASHKSAWLADGESSSASEGPATQRDQSGTPFAGSHIIALPSFRASPHTWRGSRAAAPSNINTFSLLGQRCRHRTNTSFSLPKFRAPRAMCTAQAHWNCIGKLPPPYRAQSQPITTFPAYKRNAANSKGTCQKKQLNTNTWLHFCFFNVQTSGIRGEISVIGLQTHRETEVPGNGMT